LHAALARPKEALNELDRLDCEASLAKFFRLAWPQVEPGAAYVHGWHLDALAEHLEAVTKGQIIRLLINVPPGTSKSLGVGVFWPAWEWGPKGLAHYRYVGASHQIDLQIRDNLRMRRLIGSDWYRAKWPVEISKSQDAKLKFENVQTGFRAAVAATGLTGHRGDRLIFDDPHSVEGALSDNQRPVVVRVFQETVTTRMNDPRRSAIIVVMQRLHEDDLSGHILSCELGYEHLCLPMRFESDRRCVTSIGFNDPRTEDGELLDPVRFPEEVVRRDEIALGSLGASGQFQQRPAPRGGGMFPVDKFMTVDARPSPIEIEASIRYWDKAGTDRLKAKGAGAQTAGVLMHRTRDGRFVVEDCTFGQWEALERERHIKATAETDGRGVRIYVEQEPGSGGKESAQATIRNLAGFLAYADHPTGAKEVRAEPYAAQVQAENVYLVRGAWNLPFKQEHQSFPVGRTNDMVDASAAAFNLLNVPMPTVTSTEILF
jgi:predicted phage terminase large subunit-like protein